MAYDPTNTTHVALKDLVEQKIDEVVATGQSDRGAVTATYIWFELEEASLWVIEHAEETLLLRLTKDGTSTINSAKVDKTTYWLAEMPTDFERFLSLKMTAWKTPVDAWIKRQSNRAKMQRDPFRAGDIYHPVAVMVPYAAGQSGVKSALELYPRIASDTIEDFAYMPTTTPDAMPTGPLKNGMVWYAASRVILTQLKDKATADALQAEAALVLGAQLHGMIGENLPVIDGASQAA